MMPLKVLVVDDDRALAQLAGVWLRSIGHTVELAFDGAMGLAAARAHPPDLIILDIRMPRMDGFEVQRELKADEKLRHVPIVFLTANAQETARQQAMEGGACQFLRKPYELQDLVEALQKAIGDIRAVA